MKFLKKAAMFGLDARIALAIFGALSVISGAALYSAISNSKATALLADMQEVGKAWEQYYLDTGFNLPPISTDSTTPQFSMLKSHNLVVDESVNNWNGPYLPYASTGDHLEYPLYNRIYIYRLDDNVWGGTDDWVTGNAKCTSGERCFIWIHTNKIKSLSLITSIDRKVDNADGSSAGNFRWYNMNDGYDYQIWLKYAPTINPLD
jgi:type II secretory pathway pseudopilin PulG